MISHANQKLTWAWESNVITPPLSNCQYYICIYVTSITCSGYQQRKYHRSASPVDALQKGLVKRWTFSFHDVVMFFIKATQSNIKTVILLSMKRLKTRPLLFRKNITISNSIHWSVTCDENCFLSNSKQWIKKRKRNAWILVPKRHSSDAYKSASSFRNNSQLWVMKLHYEHELTHFPLD